MKSGSRVLWVLGALILATQARAQTVTWGGGFPNNNFSVGSNWYGGIEPATNGTATIEFNGNSDSVLKLNVSGISLLGISNISNVTYGNTTSEIIGSNSLTLGAGGITNAGDTYTGYGTLSLNVPLVLAASQTWSQTVNYDGMITANGAISGGYGLTLTGDGYPEIFAFNSGSSTFSGGVTVTGSGSVLLLGANSTPTTGTVTSGPVGTGTLTLGDGTQLSTQNSGSVTLANAVVIGNGSTGLPVILGGQVNQGGGSLLKLTLTGSITLADTVPIISVGSNSAAILAGNLTSTATTLLFQGASATTQNNSVMVLQGSLPASSTTIAASNLALIFDPSVVSQISGLSPASGIAPVNANTYIGMGAQFGINGTGVSTFMAKLNPASFVGTLGFDTTSGGPQTFNQAIDLTSFTSYNSSGFIGLGSASSAILGSLATITPSGGAAGTSYNFGGGGGALLVDSSLTDGSASRSLYVSPGGAPLTLVLQSSSNTYTGNTYVDGSALIFDAPVSSGSAGKSFYIGTISSPGYIGYTQNAGFASPESFMAYIDECTVNGVIGFDSHSVASPVDITGTIDLTNGGTPFTANTFLGTATVATLDSALNLVPVSATDGYKFTGVKGGQLTVATPLTDDGAPTAVTVGLPSPMENHGSVSSVTLSSNSNSYSGGTILNSGYLYVTTPNSLGTGPLTVPDPAEGASGWVAGLAVSGAIPVSLGTPTIAVPSAGLQLNTSSSPKLTLTGIIENYASDNGMLTINGPVDLEGANSYSGGTFINGATVTIGSNSGLGSGSLQAFSSTLTFSGAAPSIASKSDASVFLNATTATFSGSPTLYNVELASASTLNFNGATALMNGLDDSAAGGSVNVINLSGTALTINTSNALDGGNNGSNFHGNITGTGSLTVTGSSNSSLDLRGANTYSGGTTIEAHTVIIASNSSALGSGPVTIDANAGLVTNTGVTVTNALTLIDGGGLAGYGTFSPGGTITFQNGSILDPGRALISGSGESEVPGPGTLTFGAGTSLVFGPGGKFAFTLADANGAAGTGYSTAVVGGSLDLSSVGPGQFTIGIFSFNPTLNAPGSAINFNPTLPYSWTLLSAASITGFNATDFSFYLTDLQNSTGIGSFYVTESGNSLLLNFTPVPEPSTWALMMSGVLALGAAVRRRRR